MNYHKGKIEIGSVSSGNLKIKHWKGLDDSETYMFKRLSYNNDRITPIYEQKLPDCEIFDSWTVTGKYLNNNHHEADWDETIPRDVIEYLEEEGYEIVGIQ